MSEVNTYNIRIHQGGTWNFNLYHQSDAGVATNLTGYTAVLQVRDKPGGKLLTEFTTANGRIAALDTTGLIAITATAAVTVLYTWTHGVYDLYIKHSTDEPVNYLLKGSFDVDARVSQ